jgi:hypothetical protein
VDYQEYVRLRHEGKVCAGIENSVALKLIDYLPKRYRVANTFWSWVWILSIPGFICVSIFWKWWVGLLLLFFVTPTISRSVKRSAAEFVLEYASNNELFFNHLVEKDLIVFKENT